MFRKVFVLTAILSVLMVCNVRGSTVTSTWVGGASGNWETAANWSPAIVPDNNASQTFAVTIDGGSSTHVYLRQYRTIDQLVCYGEEVRFFGLGYQYEPIGLVFAEPNSLINHSNLRIEIDIIGDITNTAGANLYFHDDNKNIFGNLYNHAGSTIEVQNDDRDIEEGKVENAGIIYATNGGGLDADDDFLNSGKIELYFGRCYGNIFDNNNTGIIEGCGSIGSDELIVNRGCMYASHGQLVLLSKGLIETTGTLGNKPLASLHVKPAADVNNLGTIEVNASGGIVFDCNLVNEPNGIIKLFGGTLSATTITQSADANFTGFGGITGNVLIDPNGLIKLTGPTNIVGNVTIQNGATLEISDGQTLVTGLTTNNGTIHVKGGRFVPQGGLTGTGNIIWEAGGPYNNMADFNLDGKVDFGDFAVFADTWLWQATSL